MNLYSAISRKASQLRSVHQYLANKIVFSVRRKTPSLIADSRSTGSEFQTVGPPTGRPECYTAEFSDRTSCSEALTLFCGFCELWYPTGTRVMPGTTLNSCRSAGHARAAAGRRQTDMSLVGQSVGLPAARFTDP